MTEWYRQTTWDVDCAAEFETHLARARSQKAQYLRIQGITLAHTHPDVALALLERCAQTNDEYEAPRAISSIGRIHLQRGDSDAAIAAYDRAITRLETAPELHSNAPADFCFLVAFHSRTDLYDRAWAVLQTLPAVRFGAAGYARFGAMAVILAHRGDIAAAAQAATEALHAALDRPEVLPNGLQMHPDATVAQIDNPFTTQLLAIRAAMQQPD